ncbi:XdhC family protein [Xanthovirga aplysinae]|uniref:XdhC family protein n=1 Tax=Xanthovirga aplysinae TaxID=2529853 RepID=UPI0012BD0407|nr:XdhC family protein [Xanthovirga aplysinae]MTI32880.1 XdhC/CoxI family protein [Xanthovirga aplysinae]
MKEIQNIVELYDSLDLDKHQLALATVVKVIGSSYRQAGARMMIVDDGRWVGSISGGCLEGDALRRARKVMLNGKAEIITYDTREESNTEVGLALGCNGVIEVLIEPIDTNREINQISLLKSLLEFKSHGVLATVFRSDNPYLVRIGERLLLNPDQELNSAHCSYKLQEALEEDIKQVKISRKPQLKPYYFPQGNIEVFFEIVLPPIQLMIFGAGFDAKPLTEYAKSLGWKVSISDECIAHLAPINFPSADQIILCKRSYVRKNFFVTPYTAVVLMSHNYKYDKEVLKQILPTQAGYIGILGPRKRTDKIFQELEEKGITFSEEQQNLIHSPIGLDIGASTPDEIALSIITEILAKFSHRSGGFLRNKKGPIHQRNQMNDLTFRKA